MQQYKLIGHGAEAKIYDIGIKDGIHMILKKRLPKKYRHKILDNKLNENRVKTVQNFIVIVFIVQQFKNIEKCYLKKLPVPKIFQVNYQSYEILMEFIQGIKMKDYLNKLNNNQDIQNVMKNIGLLVKKIHNNGIIHGDLTTSNMIIKIQSKQIYLIDFGLSYAKVAVEDKAVDLYVLQRAMLSTHPSLQQHFKLLLQAYGDESVLNKLEIVRQRGRKKVAFG